MATDFSLGWELLNFLVLSVITQMEKRPTQCLKIA